MWILGGASSLRDLLVSVVLPEMRSGWLLANAQASPRITMASCKEDRAAREDQEQGAIL